MSGSGSVLTALSLSVAAALAAVAAAATGAPAARGAAVGSARAAVGAAASPPSDALTTGAAAATSARTGVGVRDLGVLGAVGPGARAVALRGRLGLAGGDFRAVLVGKDGGAKLASGEPIPPQRLFATIDAMPMRRDEARARR